MSNKSSEVRPASTRDLVLRLVREHVRPHLPRLLLAVSCMAVAAGGTAALAYLMEPVLDDVFINKDREMLILVPVVVILATLLKGAATYGQAVLMAFVGQRIIADLQTRLFRHVIRFDLAFFHDTASGKLVSRMTNDINLMRNAVANALTGLVKDSLTLVFLVAVMFEKDWKLALLAFVVFPIAIYPIIRIGRRMRKVSTSALDELGRFTARLNEAFQGARHVKAYNMEAFESARTETLIESVFRLIYKALKTRAAASPIMETLGGVFIAVIILYGGWQVIEEALTPGEFFAFITAMLLAYQPLKALANLNTNLQEGLAATERVFDILDRQPAIISPPDAPALEVNGGEIIFDKVSFTYGTGTAALRDISLDVPAGRTVALVGPSGAGKSTILNLIPRFYDAESGSVSIDGINVDAVDLASLRDAIGLVSQETVLFDDSVRANIAYGRPAADEAELIAAAKGAGAHAFIEQLPDGYDTMIGEHGAKISGGQRQRLSIARAMLKDAPILLLDEATSALDPETERQIQQSLRQLMQGRTTLVIAHRLTTVLEADIIHFIKDGNVVESGSHRSLMAKDGAYARLYSLELVPADELGEASADGAAD
ncbi:MAG: Lipid A export ATP-binding/permease protein MsbA [Alphaproteobacteria bacterium MarineAlpha10_Bin2]|nr:MAG: Lipid A export ATP-binding/permease protein MsbA [Alphaproteobacteria bacterium MarineAlpha10_Bin2]